VVTLAYETYGKLSAEKDNAILICHAFSGDAHAAGFLQGEEKTRLVGQYDRLWQKLLTPISIL